MDKEELEFVKLMFNSLIDFCIDNNYEILKVNVYRETAWLLDCESFHERVVEFDRGIDSWV